MGMDADDADVAKTAGPGWPRLLRYGLVLSLTAGVLWRVGRYFAQFPIWGDEAFVLLNLLDLDYLGLAGGLKYAQVAPLFFLWIEEASLNFLGSSELALRLASLVAGVGGLLLFWRLCRHTLAPLPALLAIAFFAVSYFPVRHSCEVKPYAFDLFWSVALFGAALRWLGQARRLRWLVILVLVVPLALFSSYPAVFVAGALSIALLPAAWQGGRSTRLLYVAYNMLLVLSFIGHYALVARRQASPEEAAATHDFMRNYWRDSFPPEQLWRWPAWLIEVHTGNMFAYPLGGKHGASACSFALFVLGALALLRQRRYAILAVCLLPFGLTLLAALLDRYPYGGSARVAQHLAAPICLLMGVGTAALLERLRSPLRQQRWALGACVVLAGFAMAGLVYDWVKPYKTFHDWEGRRLARELGAQLSPGDTILVCNLPNDVSSEMKWYLRNERCDVRWLERDPYPDTTTPNLWLLFFDVQPNTEARVRSLLRQPYEDWLRAECRQTYLPPENNVAQAYYCTCIRLVPPTGRSAVARSGL
jgi:hypothetical protein